MEGEQIKYICYNINYNMSKTYLLSGETLKTIAQGALGSMTFGAYHQFTTNKLMELNNKMINSEHKREMDKMEMSHKKEMAELNEKLEKLLYEQSKKRWW